MSIKDDAFPSSAAFDAIASALKDETERKNAVKAGQTIIGFTLKNAQGKTASWYLDLKEKGEIGRGEAPEGKKADATLNLSDADFQKLVDGKAKAQQLFMSGKLKVKGNPMKATKIEPVLNKARAKAKL